MQALRREVFTAEALDAKAKHLIAVAVAYVKQCPDCVRVHTTDARREGATEGEIVEVIRIAAHLDGGGGRAARPLEPRDDPWIELDHYE
ncbi:MAG TPA: carboxymuconolactone decarboxylase family protein [Candidatus Polarisedimenticolia bacterium]|nr:carboxymuconolactone decarboxylase family protein [Candidatus Polarisedimenticolia bacterium]